MSIPKNYRRELLYGSGMTHYPERMALLDKGKWKFCSICREIIWSSGCECGSTTCNAMGCDKCNKDLKIAAEIIEERQSPLDYNFHLWFKRVKEAYEGYISNDILSSGDELKRELADKDMI